MATIQEALSAAHGHTHVSAAKAAQLHALLTDLNYHTEAALLDARQHGLTRQVAELERIAALRNERGSLRGLADDGTPLARKRDAIIAEIEAHKDGGGRTSNPYGHRTANPPKKPVTVRFKPAELKAIAEQRGATYFVKGLESAEGPHRSERFPGYFLASFLSGCQRHWTGLQFFRGMQVKIEPYGVDYNKPAPRSVSVSVKLDPNDTAAISDFTEVYVPTIINSWIDASDARWRQQEALNAISRTGNPSDESERVGNPSSETERVRSAIVGLRSFVSGSLDGTAAAYTGEHFTVDQPIYADGGGSTTHLNSYAAQRFDAAQAAGERAASRGDKTWYVIRSQNLPIAWHTPAGWTIVHKSTVVGANPTTSRNIAIVKGALGIR
jgi:hypothetical protein